ncbi:CBASS cGAMP-activated phospholipase [Shumkonia mesophila]|uniref:CBASS cGAMP-activated phospholipase n=1 Tax=Shumkonia mesophila TaxID=2838854 RepID=UPI00293437E6|nr:CBASS cGAMP-activated phospholipase [Shumkonia mesophila]
MFTDRRANSLGTRRRKQPWPADRPFKILSLDGGGIRGAYTAELMRLCEEHFGKPAASVFDMIAGTSTGGIIALGLGLGISAAEIYEFYRDDGRKIFPPLPSRKLAFFWRWVRSVYSPCLKHEELESALQRRFGEHLLGESTCRLVVPAFMMPETEIAVFKTDHHEDFLNDHATPMWKVARATSAAPTYLRGLEHEESGRIFLDGGVWANNPAMVALVDALTDYEISPDQVEILSIGTGNAPFSLNRDDVMSGLFAWREAIKAAMFLTTDNATAQAKLLLGPEHCLRIEPTRDDAAIEMDDYDAAFASLPKLAAMHFASYQADIAPFYEQVVAQRERHRTKAPDRD